MQEAPHFFFKLHHTPQSANRRYVVLQQPAPASTHGPGSDASWEVHLPASMMQFFCLLHSLRPRDPLWTSADFLHALASAVYPAGPSEVGPLLWTSKPSGTCSLSSHLLSLYISQAVAEPGDDTPGCRRKQKPVWDFMRILLMDSLLNVCANATTHPLILLLEVNSLKMLLSLESHSFC